MFAITRIVEDAHARPLRGGAMPRELRSKAMGTRAALAARMAAIVSARGPGPTAGVMPEMCRARAPSRMRGQSNVPGVMRAKALPARS